jgi:hypothetical protein
VDLHGQVPDLDVRCFIERRDGYRLILKRGLDVILSEAHASIHSACAHAERLRREVAQSTTDLTSGASLNTMP